MALIKCFFILALGYFAATYKLTDLEDSEDTDIESQVDLQIVSKHLLSQREIEPYKEGASPEAYMTKVRGTTDCQKERFQRMNLCAATCKQYKVTITPNTMDNKGYYALDEAKICGTNEKPPECSGSEALTVLKQGDKFNIKPKDSSQFLRVRQVCGFTFGVKKVTIEFNHPNGTPVTVGWTPQKTPNTFFNFGCTTNSNFIKALDFNIILSAENPTFNLRDLYAEVCV